LCAIAAVAAPRVQEYLQAAFAQGVRRQGESEQRDRKHAPEAPGPYPGRKADWAPSVVKRGLSQGVEELFEACPAWMPDVTGADVSTRTRSHAQPVQGAACFAGQANRPAGPRRAARRALAGASRTGGVSLRLLSTGRDAPADSRRAARPPGRFARPSFARRD